MVDHYWFVEYFIKVKYSVMFTEYQSKITRFETLIKCVKLILQSFRHSWVDCQQNICNLAK